MLIYGAEWDIKFQRNLIGFTSRMAFHIIKCFFRHAVVIVTLALVLGLGKDVDAKIDNVRKPTLVRI